MLLCWRPGVTAGPLVFFGAAKTPARIACRGFSMVELVVVIVILGIVAAIALPSLRGSGFEERALRDQIVSALRYAQKSAIAARRTVCVTFVSSPLAIDFTISGAYGASDCSTGGPLAGPSSAPLVIVPTGSTSFSCTAPSLTFDASGKLGATATVTVSGLPANLAITVESETGYVH